MIFSAEYTFSVTSSGVPYIGLDDFASMHRLTETVLKNRWDNIFYFSPAIEYPNAFAQRLRYEGF